MDREEILTKSPYLGFESYGMCKVTGNKVRLFAAGMGIFAGVLYCITHIVLHYST